MGGDGRELGAPPVWAARPRSVHEGDLSCAGLAGSDVAGAVGQLAKAGAGAACAEAPYRQLCVCEDGAEETIGDPAESQLLLNYQLLLASGRGDLDGIREALDAGAEVETRLPVRRHVAVTVEDHLCSQDAEPGDEEALRREEVVVLGQHGVFQAQGEVVALGPTDEPVWGLTPLMRAARDGHSKAVALLLERGAAHAEDDEGRTALHLAAAADCWESCAALLLANADAAALDARGRSAFTYLRGSPGEAASARWLGLLRQTPAGAAAAAAFEAGNRRLPGTGELWHI